MKKAIFFLIIVFSLTISLSADTYTIDKNHTRVSFTVKHMVINKVTGIFRDFSGAVEYDPKDVTKSSVNGTIKAASIDTNSENRDNDLRSGEGWFEVEKYPEITFQSKSIEKKGDGYVVHGTFTMHGVTKDVAFNATLSGPIKDPYGNSRIGIEVTGTVNRQDYGLTWSHKLDTGGLVAGDDVQILINAEAIMKAAAQSKP
jgi:polyisoprenoid-binding protein YceI